MRLTRLYLRNYRVYEDPLELEIPPGLVGIYGPNGAGKSVLLESILFTLYGRARTAKDEIRTAGVNAECVTEVEFEHEGHLYLVRRTIAGRNSAIRAQAFADGAQVAEGVRDAARYVHSVLGMDDVSFRASVFAEQKQLAAFSANSPAERRRLVLGLLGITPLDAARDQARRDARAAHEQLDRLRSLLPDRQGLSEAVEAARVRLAEADSRAGEARRRAAAARTEADAALTASEKLADTGREYDALVRDGTRLREERDRVVAAVQRLTTELAGLDTAEAELAAQEPRAAALADAEEQLRLVTAVEEAAAALAAVPEPTRPEHPDEAAAEAARTAAEREATRLAELEGQLAEAKAELERARQAAERSQALSGGEACPLCGQALGEAFAQVQAHRSRELDECRQRVGVLDASRAAAAAARSDSRRAADAAVRALGQARDAWSTFERAIERHRSAAAAHGTAVAALGRPVEPGERRRREQDVAAARQAAERCARLRGRLERRAAARDDLESEQARLADLDGRLEALRDKVRALGFRPEQLAEARATAQAARARADAADQDAQQAAIRLAAAGGELEKQASLLAAAEQQHRQLVETEEETRHLGRVAELLGSFRNTVVATVGPRLSAQAADLFGELTDREYDRLEVDPDTYEIQIRDAGVAYGMDRFSGSETDLANLALRVAISEHVRFQSGGAVGLLVLDEVFGPLDDDRKERMLLALERLRGRFRQVLVVTHDPAIKEQLPGAIEVVKRRGRRATARLLNA